MQTGAIISGWGHLIVIGLAALSGPIFEESKDAELTISEVSIVSLSELDFIQKKFETDLDNSDSLIKETNEDSDLSQERIDDENVDPIQEEIDVSLNEIIATSTPSIESPELPEIANSTPSGFDTDVSVVGEEVALNLDVPDGTKLESPDQNFDISVDSKPYPKISEEVEESDEISKMNSLELTDTDNKLPEDNTAPEHTITQPIIDALIAELSVAPMLSVRPKGRSLSEARIQEDPAEKVANNENILSESAEPVQSARNAPSGPPLTDREKDNFRVSVGRCWNKTSLSREALDVTVTILFNMSDAGYPENESIRMIDSIGGSASATKIAFNAARRAMIRSGLGGFNLPEEKYSQWKTIRMVFDPIKLRMK